MKDTAGGKFIEFFLSFSKWWVFKVFIDFIPSFRHSPRYAAVVDDPLRLMLLKLARLTKKVRFLQVFSHLNCARECT